MKKAAFIFLLILLAHIGVLANVRVLSIGISQYPESYGWNKLNAHNDILLMQALFPDAIILENSNATRRGIESELNTLRRQVVPADTIIIHFSGHGQQILTKASAGEIDGVDEAIVPYDASRRKSETYHGQNHITDDTFGSAVDALRRAVGPKGLVIAVIDACHSDSMDKDVDNPKEIYRGTDEIFGSENMSDIQISALGATYHKQDESQLKADPAMGNVVYLSACRSDQRNYEVIVQGNGYGSLTYYVAEALKNEGLSDMPRLLSAIYLGMKNNKSLRFHGQLPVIRSTLGWEAPTDTYLPSEKQECRVGDPAESTCTILWWAISATLIVILIALWIAKKKRK